MNLKRLFRLISFAMLIVAIVFLSFALTHPEFGAVFYIGPFRIGVEVWYAFYVLYLAVMAGFFAISFFVKDTK